MRRILMLSSSWGSEYTKTIINGIIERLKEEEDGYEFHIFNAYDDWQNYDYYAKDNEIYQLPNPEDYDGLILAFNSVVALEKIDAVADYFFKHDKPVVSIDKNYEGATFCGLDNYRSMYRIVDHMITIHDCRTLNYVGGPENHEENRERYRAYCDCLKAHGITLDPKRVVHKGFMFEDGENAYKEFKEYDYHMPDAVICANDKMAIKYTEAAIRDGILVPDYLKITGFDETAAASAHSPSITSVDRNWKQLGKDSADTLLAEIDGAQKGIPRYTEGSICYNESCGCELSRDIVSDYNQLIISNNVQGELGALQMHVRQRLLNCHCYKDFEIGLKESREALGFSDIAVCVDGKFESEGLIPNNEGYSDEFDMFTETDKIRINKKEQLYPVSWKEKGEKTFMFSPLHFSNSTIGYSVMPYRSDFVSRVKLRTLTEGLSIALGSIIMRRNVTALKKALEESKTNQL